MRRSSIELPDYVDNKHLKDLPMQKTTTDSIIDPDVAIYAFTLALNEYNASLSIFTRSSKMELAKKRIPGDDEIRKNPDLAILNFLSGAHDSDKGGLIGFFYKYLKGEAISDSDCREKVATLRIELHRKIMQDTAYIAINLKSNNFPRACLYLNLHKFTLENLKKAIVDVDALVRQEPYHTIGMYLKLTQNEYKSSFLSFFDFIVAEKVKMQLFSKLFGVSLERYEDAITCIETLKNYCLMQDFSNPESYVHCMSRKYWNAMFAEIEKTYTIVGHLEQLLTEIKEQLNIMNGPDSVWLNVRGLALECHVQELQGYIHNGKLNHICNMMDCRERRGMYLSPESLIELNEFPLMEHISFWMAAYQNAFYAIAEQCPIHARFLSPDKAHIEERFRISIERKDLEQMCISVLRMGPSQISNSISNTINRMDEQQISILFSICPVREIYQTDLQSLFELVKSILHKNTISIEPLLTCRLFSMDVLLKTMYPTTCVNPSYRIDFLELLTKKPETAHNLYALARFMGKGMDFLYDISLVTSVRSPNNIEINNFRIAQKQIIGFLKKEIFKDKDVLHENVTKWMLIKEIDAMIPDINASVRQSMFKMVKEKLEEDVENKVSLTLQDCLTSRW